ncbi:MAG TPA: DCC1-like thiol-disulfide oxidoreductase family protein [Fimbriimonadaceae bacterium]|nr:DCC1-like thiol-disulfide oxidoreductase family protein [Fimbriimonadaceae bacterium]
MDTALATESEEVRKEASAEGPIVFYDGDCGLCARSVQFVLKRDKESRFRFAPLQGATAERLIGPPQGKPEAWTFTLLDESGVYDRSTGALKILQHLKWGAFLPALGLLIPRPLRDLVYRGIARVRYRIWGRANSCLLPTKAQMSRFMP